MSKRCGRVSPFSDIWNCGPAVLRVAEYLEPGLERSRFGLVLRYDWSGLKLEDILAGVSKRRASEAFQEGQAEGLHARGTKEAPITIND